MLADGGDIETYLREHDVFGDPPITIDLVPPQAPHDGETWDSTIHHFRCTGCGRDLPLWNAS